MSTQPNDGTVDTHTHVFTGDLKLASDRRYQPDRPKPLEDLLAVLDGNGVTRAVLVQPSFLGTDNSYLLDCIERCPDRLRGVAVVAPEADAGLLDDLAFRGVAGLRLNVIESMGPWEMGPGLRRLASLAADRGLHVELHARGERLAELVEFLHPTGVTLVVDHFGRPGAEGVRDAGFRALVAERPGRQLWVKLSGAYRVGHPDPAELARALVDALGADRLVWGSDWPWTQHEAGRSYPGLMGDLRSWLPDPEARAVVSAAAPASLFGFP